MQHQGVALQRVVMRKACLIYCGRRAQFTEKRLPLPHANQRVAFSQRVVMRRWWMRKRKRRSLFTTGKSTYFITDTCFFFSFCARCGCCGGGERGKGEASAGTASLRACVSYVLKLASVLRTHVSYVFVNKRPPLFARTHARKTL